MTMASHTLVSDGDKIKTGEKTPANPQVIDGDVEPVPAEAGKTYYSKTSVFLMVLFAGLAIGSDG